MRQTKPSDEFYTPQFVAEFAKRVLGPIYFDPYGHPKQAVKVSTMHTKDTTPTPWPTEGPWWVNPPFSQSGEQVPRVALWVTQHKIECLMLCLAAPCSSYWNEAVWSATGPQLIALTPRIPFDTEIDGKIGPAQFGTGTRDTAILLWSSNLVTQNRFRREVAAWPSRARNKLPPRVIPGGGAPKI